MSSNVQTFALAVIVVVGTFAYLLIITIQRVPTDPTILPILAGAVGTVLSYFFSTHIANGAAAKALDSLVQTSKDREAALSDARARSETGNTSSGGNV
jgi:hypothetical protein